MTARRHFTDLFDRARVTAPPNHLAVQMMTIGRDARLSLFQHPTSEICFPGLAVEAGARLRFSYGIKSAVWDRIRSPVIFEIFVGQTDASRERVFSSSIDPRQLPTDRCWHEGEADLSVLAGQTVDITFRTSVPARGAPDYAWAGWGDPILESQVAAPAIRRSRGPRPGHVLLITSDALRADHLGCYGNREVQTPNLDRLAHDGVRYAHARAQTSVSLGSYASLLSGRHPFAHGILAEWGEYPHHLSSLPVYLGSFGYHSLLAAGEADLDESAAGLSSLFAESVRCLGSPAQPARMTARRLIKRLERADEKPMFIWWQCFDTHPPCVAPEPFRSRYYDGDPADPARRYLPEKIPRIRGVESLEDLLPAMTWLEQGRVENTWLCRLKATVRSLKTGCPGPDLDAHLRAAPPALRHDLSPVEFAGWLEPRVAALEAGEVPEDMLRWLRNLKSFLSEIEYDIVSWLDGVTDFRYPLAQYKASVSALDHAVGEFLSALRERGLYDDTTIVFTSPHGEAFGEGGVYFHHHALYESVLRVPLLIKPGRSIRGSYPAAGTVIDGVFDSIDLFPTLVSALGLPVPTALDGVSRWPETIKGSAIPPHDSFACDRHARSLSIVADNRKYTFCRESHSLSASVYRERGDAVLHDLVSDPEERNDLRQREAELATALDGRLQAWYRANER